MTMVSINTNVGAIFAANSSYQINKEHGNIHGSTFFRKANKSQQQTMLQVFKSPPEWRQKSEV